MDYKNTECPVCKRLFSDGEDIVVCPDCGAPYHRGCYDLVGSCLYKDVHGTDKAYSPARNIHNNFEDSYEEELKVCPRCGNNNSKSSMFCESCGFIFTNVQNNPEQKAPFIAGLPFIFDPMGGVDPHEFINEVPAGEIAKYVRTNTPYYMTIFKKIKDVNKSKFNFGAFLFSGAWFLYRKQYKIGSIITAIVFSIMIVSSFITYNYTQNDENILFFLPYILSFLNLSIMIFSGFFANRLYLKYCIKSIKYIKETSTTEMQYKSAIDAKGGVNVKVLPVLLICYAIIEYLPRFLVK